MTIKLTHEQALLLRVCTMLNVFYERRTARRLAWLIDKDLVYSDRSRRGALTITMMGEAALAAYDAHYTTIETAELERLRAFERKIGIFLEHMTSGNAIDDPLEFGGVRIEWVKSGDDYGFWFVTKVNIGGEDEPHVFGGIDYYFSALRKAFELFEVPA